MCNLYSLTKGQSAIRNLFAVKHDCAGNLPPLPAIFPDQMAPIVRVSAEGERELVVARWGMPWPPQFGGQSIPLPVKLFPASVAENTAICKTGSRQKGGFGGRNSFDRCWSLGRRPH